MLRLALLVSSAALAGTTPQALLTTLLKTPVKAAELPIGFSKPHAEKQALSANARKHHGVGVVDVALKGPDPLDAFAWVVFTKPSDALADLDNPAVGNGVKVVGVVPGIRYSLVLTGMLHGRQITDAAAVSGNVLVQGVVVSGAVRERTAILLLKAAILHLKHVG